jgi:hypothetical protein
MVCVNLRWDFPATALCQVYAINFLPKSGSDWCIWKKLLFFDFRPYILQPQKDHLLSRPDNQINPASQTELSAPPPSHPSSSHHAVSPPPPSAIAALCPPEPRMKWRRWRVSRHSFRGQSPASKIKTVFILEADRQHGQSINPVFSFYQGWSLNQPC